MTYRFQSMADFAKACRLMPREMITGSKKWSGETPEESLELAETGDTSRVADAEKLVSKLEAHIEINHPSWTTDMVGAFPSVPDYVAGIPENMRRLMDAPSESTPIRIFACTTSSAGMSWEALAKRGTSILAATMGLSQCRPVELWTCTSLHGNDSDGVSNIMVRINAAPLRMSEACHALCSIGFDRNLTHGYARWLNGFNGGWSVHGTGEEGLRRMLKAAPTDLVIPPSYYTDDKIITDPVGWVRGVLDRYINSQCRMIAGDGRSDN